MTLAELNQFLENNRSVVWAQEEDGTIYLHHEIYDGPDDKVKIEPQALAKIDAKQLEQILVGGRNVDHITRITGYFSKVSGWNKGKRGELVNRDRVSV